MGVWPGIIRHCAPGLERSNKAGCGSRENGGSRVRSGSGLKEALKFFDHWGYLFRHGVEDAGQMEVKNMLQVGEMVAEAALARRESRGGHYRVDYPDTRRRWQKHIIFRR